MEANICVQIERSQAPNATSNGGDASSGIKAKAQTGV